MNIFVGNLSYSATDVELSDLFQEYGNVVSAKIIFDRETRRSKGFGFVEMEDESAGTNAIESLNEAEFMGRKLVVNKARPRN